MIDEFKIGNDRSYNPVFCLTETWLNDTIADFEICSQFLLYFEMIVR